MNYFDTFILVAPDCPVESSVVPLVKGVRKSIAVIEYELLSANPYRYTQEELQFEVYIQHRGISGNELQYRRKMIWDEFFSKSRACLRASALPKKYGWGIHFNTDGKIGLIPLGGEEYGSLANDRSIKQLKAFRNKRV